jgi:hypothetical protein
MGVLTHLDTFKNNKALQRTKKNLKHRFWTEVYQERRQYRYSPFFEFFLCVITVCHFYLFVQEWWMVIHTVYWAGRQAVLPVRRHTRRISENRGTYCTVALRSVSFTVLLAWIIFRDRCSPGCLLTLLCEALRIVS